MDENKLIYSIDNKKVTYDDFTLIKVLERNLGKLLTFAVSFKVTFFEKIQSVVFSYMSSNFGKLKN